MVCMCSTWKTFPMNMNKCSRHKWAKTNKHSVARKYWIFLEFLKRKSLNLLQNYFKVTPIQFFKFECTQNSSNLLQVPSCHFLTVMVQKIVFYVPISSPGCPNIWHFWAPVRGSLVIPLFQEIPQPFPYFWRSCVLVPEECKIFLYSTMHIVHTYSFLTRTWVA